MYLRHITGKNTHTPHTHTPTSNSSLSFQVALISNALNCTLSSARLVKTPCKEDEVLKLSKDSWSSLKSGHRKICWTVGAKRDNYFPGIYYMAEILFCEWQYLVAAVHSSNAGGEEQGARSCLKGEVLNLPSFPTPTYIYSVHKDSNVGRALSALNCVLPKHKNARSAMQGQAANRKIRVDGLAESWSSKGLSAC